MGIDSTIYFKTPMVVDPNAVVSLRPGCLQNPALNPVGLLITETEAIDAITLLASHYFVQDIPLDLKNELFAVTEGHPGALVSLVEKFEETEVSRNHPRPRNVY